MDNQQISELIIISNKLPIVENDFFGLENIKYPVHFFGDEVIKAITDHIGSHLKDPATTSYMDMLVPPVGFSTGFDILKWLPMVYDGKAYWNKDSVFYLSKWDLSLMAWNLLLQTKAKRSF